MPEYRKRWNKEGGQMTGREEEVSKDGKEGGRIGELERNAV